MKQAGCALAIRAMVVVGLFGSLARPAAADLAHPPGAPVAACALTNAFFHITADPFGIAALASPTDPYEADLLEKGRRLGIALACRSGSSSWQMFRTDQAPAAVSARPDRLVIAAAPTGMPVRIIQTFAFNGAALDWTVDLESTTAAPVEVGDLALAIPWQSPGDVEDPRTIFERTFVKHQFIAGHGSFLYFTRPGGAPPFLIATTLPGTKLEYYATTGGGWRAFIHSAATGGMETNGTWRLARTARTLGPAGTAGSRCRYGLRFRWAQSYDELRTILYEEGLFDIRVVPGMTVPEDLTARVALHTRARIEGIDAEFPAQTRIEKLEGAPADHPVYEVRFQRLGENRLTIRHDGGRQTCLEFFVTEPIETLIVKRAAFLVRHQLHRDPSKWYDGLFSVYDAAHGILRSPDDPDGFTGRLAYVTASDDPGLCKASFLAAKNARMPVREEIEALEYHVERFVWGKLQRTDRETPYPYGVYGTPNWKVNRDPAERAKTSSTNLDKMHVWRSYDYPHVLMLHFHLYEIAKKYPGMLKRLDAATCLDRAAGTARALFEYPYAILPYYQTYQWGLYNELVLLPLIDALEREGRPADAAFLRAEWEKKVKYFVYDDPYPYRSEYPFDRTAFESSHALAKYGATHDLKPDTNLWYDVELKKWYSHPVVRREDARAFMDRQLGANLAVRGWLETSYYLLGADLHGSSDHGSMSYMAQMGGWAVLDYGVNFAPRPHDWLQLGYASYLGAWSLMNTGRPDTNYGFWFPGAEKDGAAGWQFMPAQHGHAWIKRDVPRGPWPYDGEIDLGFGGALRTAATVLTKDPIFGWWAYGGALTVETNRLAVIPRDGLRQRFFFVLEDPARRLKIELDRDAFAREQPVVVDPAMNQVAFTLENRTGDAHATEMRLMLPDAAYELKQDGAPVKLEPTGDPDYPWRAMLSMTTAPARITLRRPAR